MIISKYSKEHADLLRSFADADREKRFAGHSIDNLESYVYILTNPVDVRRDFTSRTITGLNKVPQKVKLEAFSGLAQPLYDYIHSTPLETQAEYDAWHYKYSSSFLLDLNAIDIRSGRNGCWLDSRVFTEQELLFLISLVRSNRSLGETETAVLLEKLCSLYGINFGYRLKRQLRVYEQNTGFLSQKADNPEVLDTIGRVYAALDGGTKLGFRPFVLGNHHLSSRRSVSPLGLTQKGRSCCLLALDEDGWQEKEIPLEEMSGVLVLDAPAVSRKADAS